MKLEKVENTQISFARFSNTEKNLYREIGDISVGIGLTGLIIEALANQDAGLIINSAIASAILWGIAISNIPEYKIK